MGKTSQHRLYENRWMEMLRPVSAGERVCYVVGGGESILVVVIVGRSQPKSNRNLTQKQMADFPSPPSPFLAMVHTPNVPHHFASGSWPYLLDIIPGDYIRKNLLSGAETINFGLRKKCGNLLDIIPGDYIRKNLLSGAETINFGLRKKCGNKSRLKRYSRIPISRNMS
ncbi:hypothetical protein QE152_g5499 [Popillia japonica]|uniref:DNA-directed DNA polymerase n=1 Tax=Popillia japonica TaxID=7064 RepID=A0AAW1MIJ1_POPJA